MGPRRRGRDARGAAAPHESGAQCAALRGGAQGGSENAAAPGTRCAAPATPNEDLLPRRPLPAAVAPFRSPAHRHLAVMVGSVLVVHALAIAVYYAAHIAAAAPRVRQGFTTAWTLATLVVVGVGLRRIRRARGRS